MVISIVLSLDNCKIEKKLYLQVCLLSIMLLFFLVYGHMYIVYFVYLFHCTIFFCFLPLEGP